MTNPLKAGFEKRYEGIRWSTSTLVEKYSVDQTVYATTLLGRAPSGDELKALTGEPEDGIHEDLDQTHVSRGVVSASDIVGKLDKEEWSQIDKNLRSRNA